MGVQLLHSSQGSRVSRSIHVLLFSVIMVRVLGSSNGSCVWQNPANRSHRSTSVVDTLEAGLLADYDTTVRPNAAIYGELNAPADEVSLQFELHSFSVSEVGQTIEPIGLFRAWWYDARLAHQEETPSEENCSGITPVWTLSENNQDLIWRPQIYFDNLREVNDKPENFEGYTIDSDGLVTYTRYMNSVFDCSLEANDLPYDAHTCKLAVSIYSDTYDQVSLKPATTSNTNDDHTESNVVIRRTSVPNRLWKLRRSSGTNFVRDSRSFVHINFHIRRFSRYHILNTMVPALLFLIISYVGFFIDRNIAPARVTIAIIPVLIMRLLLNGVFSSFLPVSYSIYLTEFLTIALFLTCFCVVEYGFVQVFVQRERMAGDRKTALQKIGQRVVSSVIQAQEEMKEQLDADDGIDDDDDGEDEDDNSLDGVFVTPLDYHSIAEKTTTSNKKPKVSVTKNPIGEEMKQATTSRRLARLRSNRKASKSWYDVVGDTQCSERRQRNHSLASSSSSPGGGAYSRMVEPSISHDGIDNDKYFSDDYNPALQRDLALLKRDFDRFDGDGSGAIDPTEVANVLRTYGVYISSKVAAEEIQNWRYLNNLRVPKNDEDLALSFVQFQDFLMNYQLYALYDVNTEFKWLPMSLKIDVVCQVAFFPFISFLFIVHYGAWFW